MPAKTSTRTTSPSEPETYLFPVEPVPASRPRVSKWGTYYGKRYTAFRRSMDQYLEGQATRNDPIREGPLDVGVTVYVRRPKQTKREYPGGDVDNYAKAILDSLNGVLWVDDIQIQKLSITKVFSDTGCFSVTVQEIR